MLACKQTDTDFAYYNYSNGTKEKAYSYEYDAWGNFFVIYHNGGAATPATNNPLTYRGYYYDSDLNLYYLRARYYDSKICRFISPDLPETLTATPMSLTDKNLYAYCDNNPVMRTDESGEWWLMTALVGAVVGAATQFVSDLVTSAVEGEWQFSSASTYIGAAVGGAVSAVMTPVGASLARTIGGDLVGAVASNVAGLVAENIEHAITGEGEWNSTEEIICSSIDTVLLSPVSTAISSKLNLAGKMDIGKSVFKKIVKGVSDSAANGFVDGFFINPFERFITHARRY